MAGARKTKVDPKLIVELERAGRAGDTVQAVFSVRTPAAASRGRPAPSTQQIVSRVMRRVRTQTGESPEGVNVFHNVGAFAVEATALFIRALLEQGEIASAVANRQPVGARIPPHRKRPLANRD